MESNYRTFPFIQLLIKYRSEIHFIYNCKLGILQLRIFAEQGDWKKGYDRDQKCRITRDHSKEKCKHQSFS